jgi:hypothetical protein
VPFFRKTRDEQSVDPNARSPESGLKYKDLAVLGQLMKAGADLTQPRHVVHYLYFGSRDAADAAAADAQGGGFTTAVKEPLVQFPGQWRLVAERQGVVDAETVRNSGDFFDSLAVRHSGEYDGWEASV